MCMHVYMCVCISVHYACIYMCIKTRDFGHQDAVHILGFVCVCCVVCLLVWVLDLERGLLPRLELTTYVG